MASKVLSDADLSALMSDVESMDKDKLKALAEEFQRKMAQDKEKRKQYHQKKTPEQIAKQREYMKTRSAKERARMKLIMEKAVALGLIDEQGNIKA